MHAHFITRSSRARGHAWEKKHEVPRSGNFISVPKCWTLWRNIQMVSSAYPIHYEMTSTCDKSKRIDPSTTHVHRGYYEFQESLKRNSIKKQPRIKQRIRQWRCRHPRLGFPRQGEQSHPKRPFRESQRAAFPPWSGPSRRQR